MNIHASKTFFPGALALVVAMVFSPVTAHADKIYKWVDANGVTHYGEQAPKEKAAEAARVKITDTTSSDADAELEKLNKARESRRQSTMGEDEADLAAQGRKANETDEANRKACEAHRKNLEALKSGKRARALGPDGKPRAISEEERQAHIKLAEDELKRCENLEQLKAAEKKAKPAY